MWLNLGCETKTLICSPLPHPHKCPYGNLLHHHRLLRAQLENGIREAPMSVLVPAFCASPEESPVCICMLTI